LQNLYGDRPKFINLVALGESRRHQRARGDALQAAAVGIKSLEFVCEKIQANE
jgi:hypothetical protein